MRRAAAISLVCVFAVLVAGCGGAGGVSKGATVTVYVSAPLCAGARQELARSVGHTGPVHVRAVCLGDTGRRGNSTLAAAGAAARRAAEDSTTVGYIGVPDPVATRFSRPILESAGIASIYNSSGTTAMARLLRAIRQADGDSNLRGSVHDVLR